MSEEKNQTNPQHPCLSWPDCGACLQMKQVGNPEPRNCSKLITFAWYRLRKKYSSHQLPASCKEKEKLRLKLAINSTIEIVRHLTNIYTYETKLCSLWHCWKGSW